jgi:ArsR family metal-binding transcriptional regulator
VENPYIAKARIRSLRKYLPVSRNRVEGDGDDGGVAQDIMLECDIFDTEAASNSEDRHSAIARMAKAEEIYKQLPHLDCGSCGAPNCHALAEDIVNEEADTDDCLVRLKDIYARYRSKK